MSETAATLLDSGKTVRFINRRTRKPEIWEATSADGRWTYIRTEEHGTPWFVQDNTTGRTVTPATSLIRARRFTATA